MVPASGQGLPNGEGKDTYENVCGACHGADIVVGSEGTKERWSDTIDAMKNRGASGSEDDFKVVLKYLSTYFGTPVNINTATEKSLVEDLNLTPAEAAAVVKQRSAGNFKAFAELGKIQGVDAKKFDLVKGRIKF